jgi:hypothetical protein
MCEIDSRGRLEQERWNRSVDIYNICRKKIVDEDTIINHRLTWILLANAAFIAVCAAALNSFINRSDIFLLGAIFLASSGSIVVTLAGILSIKAAVGEINSVKEEYERILSEINMDISIFPTLHVHEENAKWGFVIVALTPWFLVFLNAMIALAVLSYGWWHK